jgi:hypothetical protein
MDTRTGEMVEMGSLEELKDRFGPSVKWFKKVPDSLVDKMKDMNRKQRRAFYRENKELFK